MDVLTDISSISTHATNNYSMYGFGNTSIDQKSNTSNSSDTPSNTPPFNHIPIYNTPSTIVICFILGSMILATILGNVFVISAIFLEKSLQGVSNYLIFSLAITDLLVAVLVMPISLINEVSIHWFMGDRLCDFWISMDVLCCTASILHLVAIAFDRFWGVSNIDYIRRRCARQILIMVLIVWVLSVSISIPPLFGWKDEIKNPETTGECIISQDYSYTIFSTVGAFYCPLILMLVLNYKIYMAARSRIRKKHFGGRTKPTPTVAITITENIPQSKNSSGSDVSQDGFTVFNASCINDNEATSIEPLRTDEFESSSPRMKLPISNTLMVADNGFLIDKQKRGSTASNNNVRNKIKDREKRTKDRNEMKRERKAARVLGIITGAFVACWLPFFIMAVTAPFCGKNCSFPGPLLSFTLWLGYFNSLLNPILYTIFNPSFRSAFRKMFCRRVYRDMRRR